MSLVGRDPELLSRVYFGPGIEAVEAEQDTEVHPVFFGDCIGCVAGFDRVLLGAGNLSRCDLQFLADAQGVVAQTVPSLDFGDRCTERGGYLVERVSPLYDIDKFFAVLDELSWLADRATTAARRNLEPLSRVDGVAPVQPVQPGYARSGRSVA